jgi:hypothetical protein
MVLNYPPRVRALLKAILENLNMQTDVFIEIRNSLNPSRNYNLSLNFNLTISIL